MSKIGKYKVGSDPELFLQDAEGVAQSAIGLIGGTKDEPIDIGNNCALQEDNVMAEFCVPPAENAEELYNSITYAVNTIADKVKHLNLFPHIVPSATFTKEQLNHMQAQQMGCSSDFNAWKRCMNNPPDVHPDLLLRCSGGHIHIGYEDPNNEVSIALIKMFDLFLGVPSIILDTDKDRRKLYGKAGCFRIKPYGFEYRTLSNFWITSLENVQWVFQNIEEAILALENDLPIPEDDQKLIQLCINNQDEKLAIELIARYNIKTTVEEKVIV